MVLHLIVFCDDRHVIFKLGDIVLIYALHALPQYATIDEYSSLTGEVGNYCRR
jgi:hypothetical protein